MNIMKSRLSAWLRGAMSVAIVMTYPSHSVSANEFEIQLSASPSLMAGDKALEEGDLQKAVESFNRALNEDLTDRQIFKAHNGLCISYNKRVDFEQALAHCDKAIALRKGYYGGYVNRGNVYLEMRKYDEAIANYRQANELMPTSFIPARNIEIANLRRQTEGASFPQPPQMYFESNEHDGQNKVTSLN